MTRSPSISFEFFPPKTDKGRENLKATREQLAALNPEYFSVTFGAGGSTREHTLEIVREIQAESRVDAAPHLSCIGSTRENIQQLLNEYQSAGIHRLVSLRGDIPEGMQDTGEFHYANELISFIRETTGDQFHIEVAAYPEMHPEADNATADLNNFKRKVESGANGAITQYFYNADAYFYFIDACQKLGINIPIVPGIMPITNYKQLASFSSACGAEIPRWMSNKLQEYGDDLESIRTFGIDFTAGMCQRLLDQGAPGLHFYTLNKSEASLAIYQQLNLTPV
ncbi:MAG: methylenetetrahydrofolate reductase [NAD(P)H] [Gammaproteobacteria bacterium]|nr:methylenetetrahydrofolate reductase [NAD(P)H] [Gammaproteobacteria bacterium]